jgi:hypothetical protein
MTDIERHEAMGHKVKGGAGTTMEGHNVQSMKCSCGQVWHKIWKTGKDYPVVWTSLAKGQLSEKEKPMDKD